VQGVIQAEGYFLHKEKLETVALDRLTPARSGCLSITDVITVPNDLPDARPVNVEYCANLAVAYALVV